MKRYSPLIIVPSYNCSPIEKPLDLDFKHLGKWENLEKSTSNYKILIGYILRHDPAIKYIKDWLKNKIIGELINVQMLNGSWLPAWRENINYMDMRACVCVC